TVCLFGPVSPEHYGQSSDSVEIFFEPVFCSPCVHEVDYPPCGGKNVCMQEIKPVVVVPAVLRLALNRYMTEANVRTPNAKMEYSDGAPLGVAVRVSAGLQGRNG